MRMSVSEKVVCLNPDPGKQATRIEAWKYEAVKRAIFEVIEAQGGKVRFKDLAEFISARLTVSDRARLGSAGWYTTVVKLDLEARGELRRVPGSSPQVLELAD